MTDGRTSMEPLKAAIDSCPIIDNHAHNLLLPTHVEAHPFEAITSEAQGRALQDTFKSLSHLRAERQLRELYECPKDANWEDILKKRAEWLHNDQEALIRKCLHGIHCILMDDGLGGAEKVLTYDEHDQYTPAPTKRIVRIETVAEYLMENILRKASEVDLEEERYLTDIWVLFTGEFERSILDAIKDPDVAGFKTVVCYRSGLDVEPDYNDNLELQVSKPFEHYVQRAIRKRKFRIERKALNDFLVLKTLEILSDNTFGTDLSKPLQFHTGLGDNDINLLQSNPAYLQPLIENYPAVPFVLLHSSYPYTREAGYLATVFSHVFLDVGEIFPMLSRDGQISAIRQSLELVPGGKLLYSTDGHWFPETYWLANKQFREALYEVLSEYVKKDDLTIAQAISMTKDMLYNNANVLYDLKEPSPVLNLKETGEANQKAIAWHPKPPPPAKVYDIQAFENFMKDNSAIQFVYVQWLDYMATMRVRIVPIAEFERLIKTGGRIGISRGNTGTLQNDGITPAVNTTGQIYIEPDLNTLRRTHKKDPLPSATVLSFWRDEDGSPIKECPRGGLQILLDDLSSAHSITILVGFEIEVTFLTRHPENKDESYAPLTTEHAWGTMTPQQWQQLPLLAEVATSLAEIGIPIQQFHAEAGAGQYEFVLPPLPALAAIDTLIQARQVIYQIAATHGLRATLHPQPYPGIGTAAHAHISVSPPEKELAFFVGGVLKHLEAICAFSMPEAVSYGRVVDDHWTGGTWVAWGTQNRETPLRKVSDGRWEVRCLDGMANMYLAMAAIVGAGLLGLKEGGAEIFMEKDCPYNPSRMSAEQLKTDYGIHRRMPATIDEALEALYKDSDLKEVMANGLVWDFMAMKKVEQKMLADMPEKERRVWLIERY
ncbi:developmental protein-like protein fluG [Mytilinidion resinicola]|uniref:Glutamine synthetase n=1 Tax=Mytilinidion resinicola TaxID=574789 RepID=A0A6A6Y705_9PEZI|nr:developmental protein-like protein fluG [Mytilinidion resinicola]KAF2803804.1 developmental protein-like protein fluG [Mytilinidion resinicola]